MRCLFGTFAGLAALSLPAWAQSADDLPAAHAAAVAAAEERGRAMYLYDQAAWHASDRFLTDFDLTNASFMRGYVVLPRGDEMLDTVFFGEIDGALVEVARYRVEGSQVVSGGVLAAADRPPLSLLAVRLAEARQTALDFAAEQRFALCADANPNTIVLPPDGAGNITVYILTPQVSNETYPLGGHYRIDIGPDGKVVSSRRFLNSCFALPMPAEQSDRDAVALVVTHLLDAQPTEVHLFASRYFPLPLYVATGPSNLIWAVADGEVRSVDQAESGETSPVS